VPPGAIEILRQQLREKFPQAHGLRENSTVTDRRYNSGGSENSTVTDRHYNSGGLRAEIVEKPARGVAFTAEAFPLGAISEVVAAGPVSGLGLWVAGLLGEPERGSAHPEFVWIDGADGFDPSSFSAAACSRLLWVRCRAVTEMFKAADLLARDGNVPFLLLDSTRLPRKDLLAFPAAGWWRLKQTVENHGGRLVVMTAFPLVPCAKQRWQLSADLCLQDFDKTREELREQLCMVPEKLHRAN